MIKIQMLKKYEITPIFVFDGDPPPAKQGRLDQRRVYVVLVVVVVVFMVVDVDVVLVVVIVLLLLS